MDDKKVIATGNTKALILQAPGQKGAPPAPQMQLAKQPPKPNQSQNPQLSAKQVPPTQ
jgi:hypothetical protein